MTIVDTNVISDPSREDPEPRAVEWLDAQSLETLYLSAITVAELRFEVQSLPVDRRRDRLYENLERRVLPILSARVGIRSSSFAILSGTYGKSLIKSNRKQSPSVPHRRASCLQILR